MSYRKNLSLSLGPIQAAVNLLTVLPSVKSDTHRYCPEHHERLNQHYVCLNLREDEGKSHNVEWGQWVLGADTTDGFKLVEEGTKPKVDRTDALVLTPVPTKEIEANTIEGPAIYYCQPSTAAGHQAWAIMHKVVKSGKTTLITKGALRAGREKLWKITTFRDYLVLREIVFPDNITDTPENVDFKVDAATNKLVTQFVDNLMTSWDDVDTTDDMEERITTWLDSGEIIERPEGEAKEVVTGQAGEDLKASIAKAIEASS
jgi:non-homologous end joining protein Ku